MANIQVNKNKLTQEQIECAREIAARAYHDADKRYLEAQRSDRKTVDYANIIGRLQGDMRNILMVLGSSLEEQK